MSTRYSFDDFVSLIEKAQLVGQELLTEELRDVVDVLAIAANSPDPQTLSHYEVRKMRDLLKFNADLVHLDRIKFPSQVMRVR